MGLTVFYEHDARPVLLGSRLSPRRVLAGAPVRAKRLHLTHGGEEWLEAEGCCDKRLGVPLVRSQYNPKGLVAGAADCAVQVSAHWRGLERNGGHIQRVGRGEA